MIKRIIIPVLLGVLLTAVCAAQNAGATRRPAASAPAATNNTVAQSSPRPTPTSEIQPVVPPWETGPVQWPVPYQFQPPQEWLPELEKPWIPPIEKKQSPAPAFASAPVQTPAPDSLSGMVAVSAYILVPASAASALGLASVPVPASVSAPVQHGSVVNVVPHMPGAGDTTLYWVQVGAYSSPQNAQDASNRLARAGFNSVLEARGELTRVLIPGVQGTEMRSAGVRLYNAGFREVWIRAK
jgi:cell division protein FtsN